MGLNRPFRLLFFHMSARRHAWRLYFIKKNRTTVFEHLDIFYDQVNRCYQIRTKSSSYIIEFDNDGKYDIFEDLIQYAQEGKLTLKQIKDKLQEKYEGPEVMDVLSNLNEFGLLPIEETRELEELPDNKNSYATGVGTRESHSLEDVSVLVLGESELSTLIKERFEKHSFEQVVHRKFDEIPQANGSSMDVLIKPFDFIILDAVEWNPYYTEELNKAAIRHKKPWMFIGGLEEYKLKVGPIFHGRETGCYNCLIKRMKSNQDYVNYFSSYEDHLRERKKSARPDRFPYLEAYYGLIANIAFLELTKFFEMWTVPTLWKKFLSINGLNFQTEEHNLLKVPFCEVCKPELEYNPAPWLETITLTQEKEEKATA